MYSLLKPLLESSEHFHAAQNDFKSHGVKISGVELDLPQMLKRKDGVVRALTGGVAQLFKKNKVMRFTGQAMLEGNGRISVQNKDEISVLDAKNILIATGSKSAPLNGVEVDGDRIGTSTEALNYPEVPKHLVVIGAGVIGLELGSVWKRLGAKVTVLEYLDRIFPGMDNEMAAEAQKILAKQGIEFKLGMKVTGARVEGEGCIVECEGQEPISCDRVLLAVGRIPNTDGLNLEKAGVQTDKRGRIEVGKHFVTTAPNVYAIGDCIAGPMLAHKATEEGIACVEFLATGYGHINYDTIPGVVYTHPEIASVGKSEEQLKDANIEYRKGVFPFIANGRARALGSTEGRVKILADAKTDRILGVHIIGARAGDLIAEAVAAMEYGASAEDLARTCHAHPTLAEAVHEAALAVDDRAIHI